MGIISFIVKIILIAVLIGILVGAWWAPSLRELIPWALLYLVWRA